MSFLAAAAASDEGGITGFLLDLVDSLGPVGVGLAILAETVIPPIPSEAVLGLAGVLIRSGEMNVVPVVLFATLGSVLGAIFFYFLGRRSARGGRTPSSTGCRWWRPRTSTAPSRGSRGTAGRRCSSAGWCRSCAASSPCPAGVVRMPFGQFLLYTAGGSLIWNSVLIGLGVAAGDFIQNNLKYFDYAVVAAVVLGIG